MRGVLLAFFLSFGLVSALTPAAADCVCKGCGCKGGPGWRGPDGQCVHKQRLRKVCGSDPRLRCTFEGTPQVCRKGNLITKPGKELDRDAIEGERLDEEEQPAGRSVSEEQPAGRSVSYVAIIESPSAGRPALVSFPDFRGCQIRANGLDEAHRQAAETVIACAKALLRRGLPLPDPRTLDQIYGSSEWTELLRGSVAFPVKLPVASLED